MQTSYEAQSLLKKEIRADISLSQKDTVDGIHIRMGGLRAKVFRLLWAQIFCDGFGRQEFRRVGPWYMDGWVTQTVPSLGCSTMRPRYIIAT